MQKMLPRELRDMIWDYYEVRKLAQAMGIETQAQPLYLFLRLQYLSDDSRAYEEWTHYGY